MEFRIKECIIPEKISFNYEELKQELQEKEYMKPFNEFKAQVNEIIGIIDKPISVIDEQVKLFEDKRKEEKLEKIKEFWESAEHPEWLTCKQIFDQRWLNASISLKNVQESITERLAQIDADVNTIANLPEFSFEALEVYKQSIDLNRAIAEGQRLADIQKRKAEAEAARLKAEAEVEKVVPAAETPTPEPAQAEPRGEAVKSWVKFAALLTKEDALELAAFCKSRQIEIKAI